MFIIRSGADLIHAGYSSGHQIAEFAILGGRHTMKTTHMHPYGTTAIKK